MYACNLNSQIREIIICIITCILIHRQSTVHVYKRDSNTTLNL